MKKFIPILLILAALFTFTKPVKFSRQIDFAKLHPRQLRAIAPFTSDLIHTGFNKAPEIGDFVRCLKAEFDIDIAVETGTLGGETTYFFSTCFDEVHTVELSPLYFEATKNRLKDYSNIQMHLGSSEKVLAELLPKLEGKKILFYLDAHWGEYCPLLDELDAIAKTHKDNCVIMIDDFKVPHRNDCHYDRYGAVKCSYSCIRPHIEKIFSNYEYYYAIPKDPMSRAKFVAFPKSWKLKKGFICKRKFEIASDFIKNRKKSVL